MKITEKTDSYNERRYGKPWIAKVDFSKNPLGEFQFGNFIGEPGRAGILEINAEPGDVLAYGQKDNRSSRYSAPNYYLVGEGCVQTKLAGKAEAYTEWKRINKSVSEKPALIEEKERILARLAEIELLLVAS